METVIMYEKERCLGGAVLCGSTWDWAVLPVGLEQKHRGGIYRADHAA